MEPNEAGQPSTEYGEWQGAANDEEQEAIALIQTAIRTTEASSEIDLSFAALLVIEQAKEELRPLMLAKLAEEWAETQSSRENKLDPIISQAELQQLRKSYSAVVDGILALIIGSRPTESEFYEKMYALLVNPVFPDEKSRAFALYWCLIDRRIPYFQLPPGKRLSPNEWSAWVEQTRTERARIRFILSSEFDQKSEEADLLLQELDRAKGTARLVLMGGLLLDFRLQRQRLEQRLAES